MFRITRILFPVDFSERSLGAGRYVQAMVNQYRAELVLLHLVEPEPRDHPTLDRMAVRKVELEMFLDRQLRQFACQRIVDEGQPARCILEVAERCQCQLIMMPTQGWGPFRPLPGSVTAEVLTRALCPVWTCSRAEQVPAPGKAGYSRVLCAPGGDPETNRARQFAAGFASSWGGKLEVVDPPPEGRAANGPAYRAAYWETAARQTCADLIVLDRSESAAVVSCAPCPVVSL